MKIVNGPVLPAPRQLSRQRSGVTDMNYAVSEYKSILESPHRQAEFEEARGVLLRVFDSEGFCIAVFSWGAISLPEEFTDQLNELIGRKIGILRLDGHHIRDLEAET